MSQTLTVTFTITPEPLRTEEQLSGVLEHLDSAGFAVGLQVDSAEIELQGRRASDS